jgi:hypothetical protein
MPVMEIFFVQESYDLHSGLEVPLKNLVAILYHALKSMVKKGASFTVIL